MFVAQMKTWLATVVDVQDGCQAEAGLGWQASVPRDSTV